VKKTTKHERENEKTIFVLEYWTLNNNQLQKDYPYVGDSFDSAANLFDHYKKNRSDIVCLRIVQLVLTVFLQVIRVDEIAVWIVRGAGNDELADFLMKIKEVPFNYSLVRKE